MPMPSSAEGAAGDPKMHHVPPPGTVSQAISPALTMNQPSPAGCSPAGVCSSGASSVLIAPVSFTAPAVACPGRHW